MQFKIRLATDRELTTCRKIILEVGTRQARKSALWLIARYFLTFQLSEIFGNAQLKNVFLLACFFANS